MIRFIPALLLALMVSAAADPLVVWPLPQIYPRAKFGQFCSANQLLATIGGIVIPIPVAMLFDHIHNNRFGYLFSAIFLFAAAGMFVKVGRNFEKRHGKAPEPHAG
jgi:MFS family permease